MNTMASTNCLQVLFKAGFLNPIHAFELDEESIKSFAQSSHLLEHKLQFISYKLRDAIYDLSKREQNDLVWPSKSHKQGPSLNWIKILMMIIEIQNLRMKCLRLLFLFSPLAFSSTGGLESTRMSILIKQLNLLHSKEGGLSWRGRV